MTCEQRPPKLPNHLYVVLDVGEAGIVRTFETTTDRARAEQMAANIRGVLTRVPLEVLADHRED